MSTMRKRAALAPLLIATLMAAASCGSSEPDSRTMTEAEAREFLATYGGAVGTEPPDPPPPPPAAPDATVPARVETSSTRVSLPAVDDPSRITLAEFETIATGMSYETVVAIVGGPGTVEYQASYGNMTSTGYSWKGPEPERFDMQGRASVSFTDDAVTSKTQFGLD